MAKKLPYYKAFPRDFLEGTVGMSLEMKGAYRLVLDLIYMNDGYLPDDQRYISGLIGCSVKRWNLIRSELLALGKLYISEESLRNFRADELLKISTRFQEKQRENRVGLNENNDLGETLVNPLRATKPEPEPIDTNVSIYIRPNKDFSQSELLPDKPKKPKPENDPSVIEAVEVFKTAASRNGWPVPQRMTPPRAKAIAARLAECGGIDGWKAAIEKAEASDFLSGRSKNSWGGFSIDWMSKPANFTKLMEDNYGKNSSISGQQQQNGGGNYAMGGGYKSAGAKGIDSLMRGASLALDRRGKRRENNQEFAFAG